MSEFFPGQVLTSHFEVLCSSGMALSQSYSEGRQNILENQWKKQPSLSLDQRVVLVSNKATQAGGGETLIYENIISSELEQNFKHLKGNMR